MMTFGLIVVVAFVLVILGVHTWCRFSEAHPPHRRAAAHRSSPSRFWQLSSSVRACGGRLMKAQR